MARHPVALASLTLSTVLLCSAALAQEKITWWEHSNPPHNNYSKELVADWNAKHPKTPVQYEFFAMTPYFKKLTAALSTRSAADVFTVIDTLMPVYTTKNT
jgi:ABC-type glycerol-3-phosphate transport system substrate-binding protein